MNRNESAAFIISTCAPTFPELPIIYEPVGQEFDDFRHCDAIFANKNWIELIRRPPSPSAMECLHALSDESLIYFMPMILWVLLSGTPDERYLVTFTITRRAQEIRASATAEQADAIRRCLCAFLTGEVKDKIELIEVFLEDNAELIYAWFR